MKSVLAGIAAVALSLSLVAFAPIGSHATTADATQAILGLGSDLIKQSAPGCTRNPPPTRC